MLGPAEQELQCWEGGVGVWGVKGGGSTVAACLPWQQEEGSRVKGSHCSRGGVEVKCKGKCFDRQSGETQEPFPLRRWREWIRGFSVGEQLERDPNPWEILK